MMKKGIVWILSLCLIFGLAVGASAVSTADERLDVLRSLQIMVGDPSGDLMLDQNVTRAQFCKMMVTASPLKDKVASSSGTSLFSDVKSGYWASGYIKLAVEQGWFVGYVDGSFKPDRNITLEEGCTALLRELGYDVTQLSGAYPNAQLTKAEEVGLRKNMTCVRGQVLTRRACVEMFYNLLVSNTADGKVYAQTLGYPLKDKEIDFRETVKADRKGPFVAETGALDLTFSGGTNLTLYVDGVRAALSDVRAHDVYYYHEGLRTVWIYREQISGTMTDVLPSRSDPQTITILGKSYTLGTDDAIRAVSTEGTIRLGESVTILLDMDGKVVSVVPIVGETVYYGMVLSSARGIPDALSDAGSSAMITTKVICVDGQERSFYHTGVEQTVGALVSVMQRSSGTELKTIAEKGMTGSFHPTVPQFGVYPLAADVQILDTDESGNYVKVFYSQLAGAFLNEKHVRFYTTNAKNEIDTLILKEVTGNTMSFAYVTEFTTSNPTKNISASYSYYQDGQARRISGGVMYPVQTGGVAIRMKGSSVDLMRQLASGEVAQMTDKVASVKNKQLKVDENVQVLIRDKQQMKVFQPSTVSAVTNGKYDLTAWFDEFGCPAGNKVRVIVAVEKEAQ